MIDDVVASLDTRVQAESQHAHLQLPITTVSDLRINSQHPSKRADRHLCLSRGGRVHPARASAKQVAALFLQCAGAGTDAVRAQHARIPLRQVMRYRKVLHYSDSCEVFLQIVSANDEPEGSRITHTS